MVGGLFAAFGAAYYAVVYIDLNAKGWDVITYAFHGYFWLAVSFAVFGVSYCADRSIKSRVKQRIGADERRFGPTPTPEVENPLELGLLGSGGVAAEPALRIGSLRGSESKTA
jgi:hypothetical protein